MKIALTVGHSKLANGCITSADGRKYGGVNEYEFNKALAPLIAKYLKLKGHTVDIIVCPERKFKVSTEEKDYKLNIVNNGEYSLVIELHLNASNSPSASGCEVLYLSDRGKAYANRIQAELANMFKSRGIVKRDNLYMLTQTKPVSIMLETFFCTNSEECLLANNNKTRLAKAIANGIGK